MRRHLRAVGRYEEVVKGNLPELEVSSQQLVTATYM